MERFVQMELFPQLLQFTRRYGTSLPHHDVHRIARRQADEEENDDRHTEHDRYGRQYTL